MSLERLVDQLEFRAARLDTFDKCKSEIMRFLEIHVSGEAATGATLMDVNMMDVLIKRKVQGQGCKEGQRHRQGRQIRIQDATKEV